MAPQNTVFGDAIQFLERLGVYDIVLPFLLIFTIVFAILEKTKVLGTDTIDGNEYTKKNLNSIVAFVAAFFVVASTRLVQAINTIIANAALLLVLIILFLMLVGTFFGEGEASLEDYEGWKKTFMVIVFLAIIAIFLHSMNWLLPIYFFLINNSTVDWVSTLILLIIIIFFMWYVTKDSGGSD